MGIRFRPEPAPEPAAIVDEKDVLRVAAENLLERQNPKRRRSYPLRLLGEKPAIEFHGLFDDGVNRLKLNPADLRSLNLNAGETVLLTTPQATEEFLVERSNAVPPEVAACSVNRIENRRLFEVAIDKTTGDCIIPSTSGRVWKKI